MNKRIVRHDGEYVYSYNDEFNNSYVDVNGMAVCRINRFDPNNKIKDSVRTFASSYKEIFELLVKQVKAHFNVSIMVHGNKMKFIKNLASNISDFHPINLDPDPNKLYDGWYGYVEVVAHDKVDIIKILKYWNGINVVANDIDVQLENRFYGNLVLLVNDFPKLANAYTELIKQKAIQDEFNCAKERAKKDCENLIKEDPLINCWMERAEKLEQLARLYRNVGRKAYDYKFEQNVVEPDNPFNDSVISNLKDSLDIR